MQTCICIWVFVFFVLRLLFWVVRLFCISRAPTPNVIYSTAQQSHKLEVFRSLQRKRAIVWCSNIRCKLKWPNGITHILRSLLSHIYIFCAENDFNGNSVNIRYIHVSVHHINYMYILVIANALSPAKKQHLRPTKLMNINSQWQFLLERVFLYLVFCSIDWCCRVVVHEVIRDNKWPWPTGVAYRTREDFSQANLNFGDCYRSLHASF